MAAGAAVVETASRSVAIERLGRLDDLARLQAARADPQPLDAAVDERAHPLQVRLEPPGCHVMRVADVPSHDRTLIADFTTFCHWRASVLEAPGNGLGQPSPGVAESVGTNIRLYTGGPGEPTGTHNCLGLEGSTTAL